MCKEHAWKWNYSGCKRPPGVTEPHAPGTGLNGLGQPGQAQSYGAQSHGALTLREAARMISQPVCMEEEVYKEIGPASSVS